MIYRACGNEPELSHNRNDSSAGIGFATESVQAHYETYTGEAIGLESGTKYQTLINMCDEIKSANM